MEQTSKQNRVLMFLFLFKCDVLRSKFFFFLHNIPHAENFQVYEDYNEGAMTKKPRNNSFLKTWQITRNHWKKL
jgi:hypothetical protein